MVISATRRRIITFRLRLEEACCILNERYGMRGLHFCPEVWNNMVKVKIEVTDQIVISYQNNDFAPPQQFPVQQFPAQQISPQQFQNDYQSPPPAYSGDNYQSAPLYYGASQQTNFNSAQNTFQDPYQQQNTFQDPYQQQNTFQDPYQQQNTSQQPYQQQNTFQQYQQQNTSQDPYNRSNEKDPLL